MLYKDTVLDQLSEKANVAQFVSFGPSLKQRHARVSGYPANYCFESLEIAIQNLLQAAPDGSVNVRSFTPENPKNREFHYGLCTVDEALAALRCLAASGLYTIVNETIDVHDGGVSGVVVGDIVEFAPNDTPRCVEKPGTVSLPRDIGIRLLETVYRFHPQLDYDTSVRIEFSLHPLRRGFRHEHTIVWEREEVGHVELKADIQWPNLFSQFIGDKAFGLLIADLLALPVPTTTVISRSLPPFTFGRSTGTEETWIRTCPVVQVPGRFTTQRGWCDPFRLLMEEDPEGKNIASILAQEGVEPAYSGALLATADGALTIEGVRGRGDEFMVGRVSPEQLPDTVQETVRQLYSRAAARLGPVRMEWVHEAHQVWVVQLHRGATQTVGRTIYPGHVHTYHRFEVNKGLEALRELIATVQGTQDGIILVGDIGVTSHLGDVLRKASIPSLIEPQHTNGELR